MLRKIAQEVQNKRPVQHQANQVKVLGSRSSVAGVAKVSDSYAQVQLRNTFQVLHDHASFDDQGCQKFRVTIENKHAKVGKKQNVAPRLPDPKILVRNEEITETFQLPSSQKSVCTDLKN